MMTRASFDAFLQGQKDVPPIIAFCEALAGRVGSTDYAALTADPALWCANLARTARLLDTGAVAVGFAHAGSVAAFEGSEDPVAVKAIETLDRLKQTDGSWLGCMGAIAGPIALASASGGATEDSIAGVKQISVERAEAFCVKRPDLLILREGAALGQAEIGMPERKAFNTIRNMASYYSVPLALHLEGYNPAILPNLAKLKIGIIFLDADWQGAPPSPDAVAALAAEIDGISVPLPLDDGPRALALARDFKTACGTRPLAFHSMGEIATNADLAALRDLISGLYRL
jgi:hypothetical protein